MKNFYNKYKEPLMFLFFGTLTTIINLIIYYLFFKQLKYTNGVSTIIAWFCALIFSFVTSKLFVFEQKSDVYNGTIKEFISFFSVRFSLGIIDLIFMLIFVDFLGFNSTIMCLIMKIISNCLIGVVNYFLSKKLIFSATNYKNDTKYIVIIFVCAILACSYLFKKGLARGDDFYYHSSLIYDLYKSAINNNFRYALNEYLLSNIGYGARLYYPPLFEFLTVIVAVTFKNYGLTLVGAFKIVIFLEYFYSGIFMFLFLKKIFKDKTYLALIGTIFYVLEPYRTINNFDRSAFAEGLALTFIPLVFSSLYSMLQDKYTFKSFLTFSISFALVFLSHTITATYLVLFGIVFALFFIKTFLNNLKSRRYRIFLFSSILLIFGLISFYLAPLIIIVISKDYIVSNKEIMGATVNNIIGNYSGIIERMGFNTFKDFGNGLDQYQVIKFCVALLLIVIEFISDLLLKKKNKDVVALLIGLVLNFTILIIFKFNLTFVCGVLTYYVTYLIFKGISIDKCETDNRLFKATIAITTLSLALLLCPFLYYLLPDYMLNIQFSFRIYSFFYFSLALLVPLVISKIGLKRLTYLAYLFFIFVGFTQCSSLSYDYIETIDESILSDNTNGMGGWQKEYLPIEFNSSYTPENKNSLYYKVLEVLSVNSNANEIYIEPIIYSGNGEITKVDSTYIINLEEDSTIQFGKIYYEGYVLKVTKDNNIYYLNVDKLDGLVSASLDKGEYQVELIYQGTKINNACKIVSFVTVSVVVLISVYYLCSSKPIAEEYERQNID